MRLLRTPDQRFERLPDFPFAPHYQHVGEARIHYVDEGQGKPVLCLHGEPTWSYLYRKMIPPLATRCRVVAMDFVGFGRSDKYADRDAYSFHMYRGTLTHFIQALDLQEVTLVVQDWGGLIGLTVAAQMPERFARLVIMNTFLPTGEEELPEAFLRWRAFAERVSNLPIGRIIQGATVSQVPPDVLAAYEAPFPDVTYKAGAAAWPSLVPLRPDDPGAAEMRVARQRLAHWTKPALIMFSDGDPVTRGGDAWFRQLMPTARQQPEIVIRDAGHFLQEDKGEEIAGHILDFMGKT